MLKTPGTKLNQKILKMLTSGLTPNEVCKQLQITQETLKKHLEEIQSVSTEWLEFLSSIGYHMAFKKNLQDTLYNRERLYAILKRIDKKLERNSNDLKSGYLELQTIAQIDKNIALHWELQNETPMVDSFNKFVQEKIVNIPKKNHLPFVPPDD